MSFSSTSTILEFPVWRTAFGRVLQHQSGHLEVTVCSSAPKGIPFQESPSLQVGCEVHSFTGISPPSIAGNLPTPRPALNPGVHHHRSGVRMTSACLCTLKDTHSWLFYATLNTTDHVVDREHNTENNSWKTITLNKLWVTTDGGGGFKKPLIVILPYIIFNAPDIIILTNILQ